MDKITTLERDGKIGDGVMTDIIVKSKKETILKNYATVRRLDDGRIEYYEKIVFTKPNSTELDKGAQMFMDEMKNSLPEGVAISDDELKTITRNTMTGMVRLMFGPDDFLLAYAFTSPDGAQRRLKGKIATTMDKQMLITLGDRMNEEQRMASIRKVIAKLDNINTFDPKNKANASPEQSGTDNMVGMSTSVKLPGKVLETNGTIDPLTGEVYWDFLSVSGEFASLELRAICEGK
jgi:hypothetical protein